MITLYIDIRQGDGKSLEIFTRDNAESQEDGSITDLERLIAMAFGEAIVERVGQIETIFGANGGSCERIYLNDMGEKKL